MTTEVKDQAQTLHVLAPAQFGKLALRNRLIVSPMVVYLADTDGKVTDAYVKYVEARAKGGFGLFTVEASYVDQRGKGFTNGIGIDDDDKIAGLKKLADAAHAHGCKISIQLHHAGRETSSSVTGSTIVAPSDCPVSYSDEPVHVLSVAEIRAIVQKFGDAARRAMDAGFDAVMIHGAHGYLLTQFLSPWTNKRVDEYGGSLENRLRISREVIEAVRKAVGPDTPISYRMTVEEGVSGGLTLQEGCEAARLLSKMAIDDIHVVAGNYATNQLVIPPYFAGHICNLPRLQAVREAVGPDFSLTVSGRVTNAFEAEYLFQNGLAQFVGMGRASLADPELPNRSAAGEFNTVRTCIGCNLGCIGRTRQSLGVNCALNPLTGHEAELESLPSPEAPKKIMVIGAGPAGMEAAWIAARRGHKVTVCEKDRQPGGQFLLAAYPPAKNDIFDYLGHMGHRLDQEGIITRLDCAVDAELLIREKPDMVFLATGSTPLRIPFPGIDSIQHMSAQEVIQSGLESLGQHVAVIGGGMVGLEAAEFIARTGRKVTVLEMLPVAAPDLYFTVRAELLCRLASLDTQILLNHKVERITGNTVICQTPEGDKEIGPIESIVMAVGGRPQKELEDALVQQKIPFILLGDTITQGNCLAATQSALKAFEI